MKNIDQENKLVISSNNLVFSMKISDTLRKVVVLYNKSEKPIKITGIENGCGCTSTILKDSTISPFDSSFIRITYIPKMSKDSGNILKYITIKSNTKPVFHNIILKGEVLQ